MKKFAFYPLLFSLNPILLLLAANISDVPISQLMPVILITPLVAAGLMWIMNKRLKDIHRAGFIVFLITFWFFHYGTVHSWAASVKIGPVSLGSHWIFLPLWTIIFVFFMSKWLWNKITSPETITMFLNLVCIVLVAFSVMRISLDLIPRYTTHPEISKAIAPPATQPSASGLPDVYYIILDGYARADILQELYNYDDSGFIQSLEDKGFYVASQSQSNYMQTALSLASSLNMEYLSGFPTAVPDRGQLIGMIRNSLVREYFKQSGYKIVAFSTGYQATDLTGADYYFSSPDLGRSHDLEALLLINSAAVPLIEQGLISVPISRYSTEQKRIDYTFSSLADQVPSIDGPKLVFAHIIAPHPPFVFDQRGPVTPDEFYILADGDRFSGGAQEYTRKYVDQLIYINQRVLQTIDSILAKSVHPPIIILQADHGPGAYLNWSSVEGTCLDERFSILNAYYLPVGGSAVLQSDITPVNTFPMILNTYFGTQIPLRANKEYYSTWNNPYQLIDVSDSSQTKCDIP